MAMIQRELRTLATRMDNLGASLGELMRAWEERADAFDEVDETKPIATELRRCAKELREGKVSDETKA